MTEVGGFHAAHGAIWQSLYGVLVPWRYTSLEEEWQALTYEGAVIEFPDLGLIELKGLDAREFLHNQCMLDVRGLAADSMGDTLFLNSRGQVEYLGTVLERREKLWVAVGLGASRPLFKRFASYIVFDQVELLDLSEQYRQIRLLGPQALKLGEALGKLPTYWSVVETGGLVMARDHLGLWVLAPLEQAEEALAKLHQAGATPVGREAYTVWRVEHGLAAEDALGELPQEVGLGDRVNYRKGCYLGQEIMARLEARGNARYRLMGLYGQRQLEVGAAIEREGRPVGRVTTAVVSPKHDAIALALLRRELAAGDQVTLGTSSATVTELPFG